MASHTTPHPLLVSLVLSGILYECALAQTDLHIPLKLFPKDDWKIENLACYSCTWFSGSGSSCFTNFLNTLLV
ncbi:hypothetical protein EDD15DRAFT_1689248 [Pisolithus albus]|nr:hypothetical protein EDD15DRAFT_1689248 [Pisolithus albus]